MDTEALRQGHERMFTFFKETFKTSPWKIITSCSINMHFTFFQYIATKWPDLTHDDYLFKSSLLISVIGIPKVKFRNGSEMADYCDRVRTVSFFNNSFFCRCWMQQFVMLMKISVPWLFSSEGIRKMTGYLIQPLNLSQNHSEMQ